MRIGIVNDMPLAVEALCRVLRARADWKIAWTAGDGEEAVRLCAQDLPDLVLMDLIMPVMDGVEATRRIMASTPCPILVVTVSVEQNSGKVYEAMGYGALDAVDTPVLSGVNAERGRAEFLRKIELLERLVRDEERHATVPAVVKTSGATEAVAGRNEQAVLLLGASTGGPQALATVLSGLPANFPAAIVIAQHVDAHFAPGLAAWLGRSCALPVKLAHGGERLEAGHVYVADATGHLALQTGGILAVKKEPRDALCVPSVDLLFQSAAEAGYSGCAVILTGMGRDGAEGLRALKAVRKMQGTRRAFFLLAQDRESCVVYGMPRAAVEAEAVDEVAPLDEMAERVCGFFGVEVCKAVA